jgi:hypothetical protein
VYGKLGYVDEEAGYRGNSADDSGILLGAGLRGRFSSSSSKARSTSWTCPIRAMTRRSASARWFFTQRWRPVSSPVGGDATTYGLGMRWSWGN